MMKNLRQRGVIMNTLKHACYIAGAILVLLGIGMLICYMLFAGKPDFSVNGTLALYRPVEAVERGDDVTGRQVCV